MLIDDADCTPERLAAEIQALVADPPRWRRCPRRARRSASPTQPTQWSGSSSRPPDPAGGATPRDPARPRARDLRLRDLRRRHARARARRPGHRLRRPCLSADERRRHGRGDRVGEPQRPREPRPVGVPDLVVVGNQTRPANLELAAVRERGLPCVSEIEFYVTLAPTACGSRSAGRTARPRRRRCWCTSSSAPDGTPVSGSDRRRSTSAARRGWAPGRSSSRATSTRPHPGTHARSSCTHGRMLPASPA